MGRRVRAESERREGRYTRAWMVEDLAGWLNLTLNYITI